MALSKLLTLAVVTLHLLAWAASPASSARYALVVGINAYRAPVPALLGAVNDARDIAAALEKGGVRRLVLLLDGQATKAAVTAAWDGLLAQAQAGDTLIFTYAGHGSQEPARAGDPEEPDGLDETFPLSGFTPEGPGMAERLVDNEVAAMLKGAEARQVRVIFVADACHSGTMYRSISQPLSFRAAPKLRVDRGELLEFAPPAPVVAETIGEDDAVTFLAGVSDDRLVPEVTINGQTRGALSFAFARALSGFADGDGDGVLTERELVSFVRATVQQQTESQQVPQSFPPVSRTIGLFDGAPASAAAAGLQTAPLMLAYRNGAGPAEVPGALVVSDPGAADLIYDVSARTVEKRVAGIVAENVGPEGLAPVVAKWSAVALLKALAGRVVPFEVSGGARTFARGERLTVALAPAGRRFMTLFNMPPNGRVEFLYPATPAERDADWSARAFSLPLQVESPPFGAETLVAILSDRPLDGLHDALRAMRSPDAAVALPSLLGRVLAGNGAVLGIADVVTSGR